MGFNVYIFGAPIERLLYMFSVDSGVVHSSEQSPFTSEIVGSILAANTWHLCENVGQRALLKVGGFLRVLQFPPTGNVDRVGRALEGWDKPLRWD
jgi:hypothetical protein